MSRKPKSMKNSEPILYQYLSSWLEEVKYDVLVGTRKPDFSIWDPSGAPIAFWEMADRQFTGEDQIRREQELETWKAGKSVVTRGKSLGTGLIEYKITNKWNQFKQCGPLPGMLVLADWSGATFLGGADVSIAFEGWPGVRIFVGDPSKKVGFCRTNPGKMSTHEKSQCYNYIAAIGLLRYECVNLYWHGLIDFGNKVYEQLNGRDAIEAFEAQTRRLASEGVDLNLKIPILEIYLNPRAHYLWPLDLHGPYDRVYNIVAESLDPILVFDGLKPHRTIEVKKSCVQLEIDSLMNDPNLRND